MRPFPFVVAFAALTAAFAVDTRFWTFATRDDHDKASMKRLSLRSDGHITLAPAVRELQDAGVSYLWAVARGADGTLYTGGGNPGATNAKVFAVKDSQVKILAELAGLQIQAIALDATGRVYAATAPDGKVFRITADGKSETFYDPKAKYIWGIAFDKAGNLFVSTGDRGEVHKVTPQGQGSVFFRTEEEHARAIAVDGAGNLIVGTEPGGLIIRVTPAGEGFVLHQAGRREITAVAVAPDGAIYAAGVGSKPASASSAPPPAPVAAPMTSTSITVSASAGPGPAPRTSSPPPTLTPSSVSGGSELIRIGADGFPTRVWSDGADIIYSIAFDKSGRPILGTGNKGAIYRVDSDLQSTRLLTLAPTQVTALTSDANGAIYAVTGNIGKLFQIGPGFEKDGVLESEVLDAGWFAEWGRLAPKATGTVTFETRSGNLDRSQKNWSNWASAPGRIASPGARFLQYRATLSGDGAAIAGTDIAYLPRNVAPRVEQIEITSPNYRVPNQSLTITPSTTLTLGPMSSRSVNASPGSTSSDPGSVTLTSAKGMQAARWKAADANGDAIQYTVEIRGKGETAWKLLKKELTVRQYSWDSTAFPDGEYLLRITASDAAVNAPGKGLTDSLESEPFQIDNTPPVIRGLTATSNGNRIAIAFSAADTGTILTKAEYSINASEWVFLEPSTKLTDSREHTYNVTVDRPAGELTVAVRVTDENENHSVEKTVVK